VNTPIELFRRVWAASALALFAATWKLWTPQQDFPQVPIFAPFGQLPALVDWIAFASVVASTGVLLRAPTLDKLPRRALALFIVATTLLLLINQHRFQPWAYQFLIIATVLATAEPAKAFRYLRWLTISIYVWSAWSKCDVTFAHNLGQQLASALVGWADFQNWPTTPRLLFAAAFPIAEFSIALALSFAPSRRYGVWASVLLHLLLLIALGPFGLHHKPGVLLWNIYFIAQNLILFQNVPAATTQVAPDAPQQPRAAIIGLVAAAILWPLVESWNYCDHWPAWSVYAPRVERTSLFIHRSERDRLPLSAQPFLEPALDDDNWFQLRLDRWSLEALDVPLYPQNRFQIAVAAGLARQFGLTQARITRYSTANRFTGKRESESFQGLGELDRAASDYWLGTRVMRPLRP
jgi:hypothetical protein